MVYSIKVVKKVVCYIVRGDELLIFRQPHCPEAGLQVPAGTIESGEDPEAAALREATEETGLSDLKLLGNIGEYVFDMSLWKPELHERHVFALQCDESTPTSWQHIERHSSAPNAGDIVFEFSWHDLRDGDPDLIADQDHFLPELRQLLAARAESYSSRP